MGYSKITRQKSEFVHKELLELLKRVDGNIVGTDYTANGDGEEVIAVFYKGNKSIEVSTCGSLGAMTIDVLNAIC